MVVVGRWRVVEMDLWDREAVELLGPAFFEFGADGTGSFRFIAVEGWMEGREACRDGRPAVEFAWRGSDGGDPARGRGWAKLCEDGSLVGRVYFYLGDDSAFRSLREDDAARRALP